MCNIAGAIIPTYPFETAKLCNSQTIGWFADVLLAGEARGRDGFGLVKLAGTQAPMGRRFLRGDMQLGDRYVYRALLDKLQGDQYGGVYLANHRAEPTTEWVQAKTLADQQPYFCGFDTTHNTYGVNENVGKRWVVVHNGTIANDASLRHRHGGTEDVGHALAMGYRTPIDSAAIGEFLAYRFAGHEADYGSTNVLHAEHLMQVLASTLVGSWALAITNECWRNTVLLMCNFKPISLAVREGAVLFTSMADGLQLGGTVAEQATSGWTAVQMRPYSGMLVQGSDWGTQVVAMHEVDLHTKSVAVTVDRVNRAGSAISTAPPSIGDTSPELRAKAAKARVIAETQHAEHAHVAHATNPTWVGAPPKKERALVVCSGGLDSVVAATKMVRDGYDVELLHYQYGCRAEMSEVRAVSMAADALKVRVRHADLTTLFAQIGNSRLTTGDAGGKGIEHGAGGAAGAEFAHEWVPCRNLIMLSVAAGIAEGNGFDYVVLGNNLEEAGAYPDNEPDFIRRFSETLELAVKVDRRVQVLQPVGNLMKHEIVRLGLDIGAPLGKTWSCYENGVKSYGVLHSSTSPGVHCGVCGPCYMRRNAFKMLGEVDPVEYKQ